MYEKGEEQKCQNTEQFSFQISGNSSHNWKMVFTFLEFFWAFMPNQSSINRKNSSIVSPTGKSPMNKTYPKHIKHENFKQESTIVNLKHTYRIF